jgi:hypothetical protein
VLTGPGTWDRIAAVDGAELPAKPRTLFGLLAERAFIGILFRSEDGKPAAVLLDCKSAPAIVRVLEALTGKRSEFAK